MKVLAILTVILVISEGVRLWWYSDRDQSWEDHPVLTWSAPPEAESIPMRGTPADEALFYDRGQHVRFDGPDGSGARIEVFYLEYEAGNEHVWQDLFTHAPTTCFPASGAELVETYAPKSVSIADQHFSFSHYLFRYPGSGVPFQVFKMVWLADMDRYGLRGTTDSWRRAKFACALSRNANPPGRQILAMVQGAESEGDALKLLKSQVANRGRIAPTHH